MTDLAAELFLVLRDAFFQAGPVPRTYRRRDKRNTQDDPLDEKIHELLTKKLPSDIGCFKAPGPLTTPDLVMLRSRACESTTRAKLRTDPTRIIGVEVKKLERQGGGTVARASGMDYNTTPPCGTVRVYDRDSQPLDIKGFYLFVCEEETSPGHYRLTALALCDGDLLNADFDLYLSIVGPRTKKTGLGTYKDGADRTRPMLIFANPLGAPTLDRQVTLIHAREDLDREVPRLRGVGIVGRSVAGESARAFHCYRLKEDVAGAHKVFDLTDPFPTPARTDRTQGRGRFEIDITPKE
jgi:hypothetical protein